MRVTSFSAAVPALAVLLASCSGSSNSNNTTPTASRVPVSLESSFLQTTYPPLSFGDRLAYLVHESERGVDLEGDGLLDDRVLFVLDASTGVETNLRVVADEDLVAGDGFFVFFQSETVVGDQNNDGDTDDRVLLLHDVRSGVTIDPGSTVEKAQAFGPKVLYTVDENDEMFDWNSDGDQDDLVGLFRDSVSNLVGPSEIPAGALLGTRNDPFVTYYDPGTGIAYAYDLDTCGVEAFEVGAVGLQGGDSFLAFHASEALRGEDLNRDGDQDDEVVAIYDYLTDFLRQTPIARVGDAPYAFTSDFVAFPSALRGAPGVALVDIRSTVAVYIPGPARNLLGVGESVLAEVDERDTGTDLNGDGDQLDVVAHLVDPATVSIRNLGLAIVEALDLDGVGYLAVDEAASGNQDLNGDGDALDLVLHTVVPATGGTPTVENLGLAAGILGVLDERFLLLAVEESQQDLSGDGDKSDRVLFILDLDTGELESLRVAVVADGSLRGTRYAGHAPVLVPEVDNRATVRNGDGDLDDTFLYLVQSGG